MKTVFLRLRPNSACRFYHRFGWSMCELRESISNPHTCSTTYFHFELNFPKWIRISLTWSEVQCFSFHLLHMENHVFFSFWFQHISTGICHELFTIAFSSPASFFDDFFLNLHLKLCYSKHEKWSTLISKTRSNECKNRRMNESAVILLIHKWIFKIASVHFIVHIFWVNIYSFGMSILQFFCICKIIDDVMWCEVANSRKNVGFKASQS